MKIVKKDKLEYITFDNLEETGMVKHCFTTRRGGVSTAHWASMNMGLSRGEEKEAVWENYRILAEAVGFTAKNYVTSQQTHTTNVRRVTAADKGKGVWIDRGYTDVDGLITNEKHIPLVIFGADCVPVFLLDRRNKAIGVAHCGWMGTGKRMAEKLLQEMMREFGTDPADVTAAIGPSIGKCCFQMDEPVLRLFQENIPWTEDVVERDPSAEGKYKMDLWECNRRLLAEMGVKEIEISHLCTKCDQERFYSHRGMGENRGVMAGIMELK
ncbi:MAG: peptidoglycan editing factor PgeF [Bacillota bacterium]|nr:peptidoglycan editing factor PgeF [Bacillota bacterium]